MKKEIELEQAIPLINEVLLLNGKVSFNPSGNSMFPTIRHQKDTVTLEKCTGNLKKYDVALYKRENGAFILHRVVGIDPNGYIMCGDNQTVKEYCINDKQIVAVMTSFKRENTTIDCDNFLYRLYCCIWVGILPLRHFFNILKAKLKRKLFGKKGA